MEKARVLIVGGGAAGFFAAIKLKEENPSLHVEIWEAAAKPLTKVKISGGGRCNLTHQCFDPKKLSSHYPRGERLMKHSFMAFQAKDTMDWFESRGVALKVESDHRVFPLSNTSQSIVDCLWTEAEKLDVIIHLRTKMEKLTAENDVFNVYSQKSAEPFLFHRVLIATGSSEPVFKILQELKQPLEERVPSLFTFKIKDNRLQDMSGISFAEAKLTLSLPHLKKPIQFQGPLLITHWGLSGPAVLKLSAWGARDLFSNNYNGTLKINFSGVLTVDQIFDSFVQQKQLQAKQSIYNLKQDFIPKSFLHKLLQVHEVPHEMKLSDVSNKILRLLSEEIAVGTYKISGKGVFKEEFVTCGGVSLSGIQHISFASKIYPHLFFAGEVLDVDGITGGFNLQNTWTSGYLAAQGILKSMTSEK